MKVTKLDDVVFIDPRVPDIEDLLNGLAPDTQVFVLDPDSDGLQQIADILADNNLTDLSSISIVGHGASGEMQLGSTQITNGSLGDDAAALAVIGAALSTNATIQLYGCDVAAGASGQQFLDDFSNLTGATVEASTHLVGAASQGGNWTLDAAAVNGAASPAISTVAPFTADALGAFTGELSAATNQIWFSANYGPGSGLVTANVSGTTATTPNATPPGLPDSSLSAPPFSSGNQWLNASIALDTADGLYFVANNPTGESTQAIYEGHISGATFSNGQLLQQIYVTPNTNGVDFYGGMVFNPANNKLYFVVDDDTVVNGIAPGGGITLDTGIYTLNVAANGTTSGLTKLVGWGGAGGMVNPHDIAIDTADNLLFFTDFGDSQDVPQTYNPRLEVANLTTGAILNSSLQTINEASVPGDFNYFWGVQVDPSSHKLYWVTADPHNPGNNRVLEASFTTGATPTLGAVTTLWQGSTAGPLPGEFAIDVANGVYYVALGSSTITTGTIVEGSLTTPGSFTTIYTLPTNTQPQDILYEPAPLLSVSGSPTAVAGGSAVDLSSSVTVTDTLQNIASATVTISGGHLAGDTLAASTTGTNIAASYNSTAGVLTLSGADTPAHYQSVLDSVTFSTTGTTAGSRTISWTVSDGHLASTTPTSSVKVLSAPTLSTTPGSTTVTLGPTSATLTDTADLTGGSNPTGSITFTLFHGTTLVDTETVTVSGNGLYRTPTGFTLPSGSTAIGTYQWDATYSGDGNNTSVSDVNNLTEQVTVSAAAPTLSTTPSSTTVTLGPTSATLTDTADLENGSNPTGSITFTLFQGSTLVDTETVTVSGNGLYRTPTGFTLPSDSSTAIGTYQWDATYSGDGNNNGATDANDPTEQVTVVACYRAGTLILTPDGDVPVEHLAIDNLVMTMSGEALPIRWIGRRSYSGRFALGQKHILPICFKAGSIADNVPKRDLWISPNHAMYLDGVLIEAKDLVNGVSIVQAERVDKIEYVHIELESHDVIIAEGALSETFLDDDSRRMFHNAYEYRALCRDEVALPVARYCAPRLEDGYEIEKVRRRIAWRAKIHHTPRRDPRIKVYRRATGS